MPARPFSAAQVDAFHRDGFVIVDDLFSTAEVELLGQIARLDQQLQNSAASRGDGEGGAIKLVVENEVTDDLFGAIVQSERIVGRIEQVLSDEVYHYHHKLILKDAYTGGAWAWHQDYGYWYNNGCLYPDLASCLIAIDRATRANGCLQVLKGSHRMGRVEHGKVGDQTGADPERVAAACERMELVYCEMQPGAGIFFHSNLLHRSDQNKSPDPRWALICCYNTRHNSPYKESRHPGYTPLEKWSDDRVLEFARRDLQRLQRELASRPGKPE